LDNKQSINFGIILSKTSVFLVYFICNKLQYRRYRGWPLANGCKLKIAANSATTAVIGIFDVNVHAHV